MADQLRAGQRVTIFVDPITCRHPEGDAILRKRIPGHDDPGFQRWYVSFGDDVNGWFPRKINLAAIKEAD